MILSDLTNLIQNRRFDDAISGIKSDRPRLKSHGLSHPVVDLLMAYNASTLKNPHYRWETERLPDGETAAVRQKILDVLETMLDGGTPMGFLPTKTRNLTNAEEVRSHFGLGHTGSSSSSLAYDTDTATLYVRMAGLGWVEGMQLLLKRGYKPDAEEVDAALVNAVRMQQASSLRHILQAHEVPGYGYWDHRNKLLGRLFRWEDAPFDDLTRVFDAYSQERTHEWIKDAHNDAGVNRQTALRWLSEQPGRWKSVHDTLVRDGKTHTTDAASPGLWTTLFREYVEHGRFQSLLDEALKDGTFAHWKGRFPYKEGASLVSWIVQGGPMKEPVKPHQDYKGDIIPGTPVEGRTFAQLRRAVRLVGRLREQGVSIRLGAQGDVSEAMEWAAVGRVPTQAFVHRHPEILLPSADLSSPLHRAKSVEVALGWEALGVPATANRNGVDPWVLSMQASDAPAPWGREIAARLKDGRISVDAEGADGQGLAQVAIKSPPLARLWLKKSKAELPPDMLEAALKEQQWGLVKEWVEEGALDNSAPLRAVFFNSLRATPYKMSDAASKAYDDMLQAAVSRPTRPWEEQAQAWRDAVAAGAGSHNNYAKASEGPLLVLSNWGTQEQARQMWKETDYPFIRRVLQQNEDWQQLLPIQLSMQEGLDLFWHAMVHPDLDTNTRRKLGERVWEGFDRALPIHQAAPGVFAQMRKLDEEQYAGGFQSVSPAFLAFLDAEELTASTQATSPSRSASPGRRL